MLGAGCVAHPEPQKATSAYATGMGVTTTAPTTLPAALESFLDPDVEAQVCPPAGWKLDPPKGTAQHTHKTWLSPTRDTAYGVIRFKLPLPLTDEMALWGFLREMRRKEGDAVLLEKQDDPTLPGLRFVAEGGIYRVRTNLTVKGFRGWCVYAGTLRAKPENLSELSEAIRSRDATKVGTE